MRNPSSPAISIRSAVSESIRAISRFSMMAPSRCTLRYFIEPVRLHVHKHIGNPGHLGAYLVARLRCDFVRSADGHLRVDFQMQVHVILQACLARETLFDPQHAWYG